MMRITTLALLAALAWTLPAQQPQESARKVFLEGWFQETADRNLEQALESYLRCKALALPSDPELAARAAYRAAQILRARGEEERAAAELRRLVEELPGTEYAGRAREELAGRGRMETVASTAAERAMAHLETLRLLQSNRRNDFNLPEMLKDIFQTLSADQILSRIEDEPWGFLVALQDAEFVLDPDRFGPTLAELVLRGGEDVSYKAMVILIAGKDFPLSKAPRILENLASLNNGPAIQLYSHLVELCGKDRFWEQALELLLRLAKENSNLGFFAYDLLPFSDSRAAETFRILAERAWKEENPVGSLTYHLVQDSESWWTLGTPSAALVREWIPRLGPLARLEVAKNLIGKLKGLAPDQAARGAALLLEDREPEIREPIAAALLGSGNPELEALGLGWFRKADVPTRARLMEALPARLPLAEIVAGTEGDLREYAYWVAIGRELSKGGESLVEALEQGLEHGGPEFLRAAFAPGFHLREPFRNLESVKEAPYGGRLAWRRFKPEAASWKGGLAKRLILAASDTFDRKNERVLLPLIFFTGTLEDPHGLEGFIEALGKAVSPAVRLAAVDQLPAGFFPRETAIELLNDPVYHIAQTMIRRSVRVIDEETLIAALRRAPLVRLETTYWELRQSLDSKEFDRAHLVQLPIGHRSRGSVFNFLLQRGDLETAVVSLETPDLKDTSRKYLLDLLAELPPEDRQRFATFERGDSGQEWTPAHFEALARASRKKSIARLLGRSGETNQKVGQELARLGALEELIALPPDTHALVKAWGFQALGRTDLLLKLFESLYEPALLPVLFAAGLQEDVKSALAAGRLPLDWRVMSHLSSPEQERMFADLVLIPVPFDRTKSGNIDPSSKVLQALERLGTPEEIARYVSLYHESSAFDLLVRRKEYPLILSLLPSWPKGLQERAAGALQKRTGLPPSDPAWPRFESERIRLMEQWRRALEP